MITTGDRALLVARMEAEIRPLLDVYPLRGGYDCCGCSTYDEILDHVVVIIRGEPRRPLFVDPDDWDEAHELNALWDLAHPSDTP